MHQCLRRERGFYREDFLIRRYRRCRFALFPIDVAEEEPGIVNDESLRVCSQCQFALLDSCIYVPASVKPFRGGIFGERYFEVIGVILNQDNPFESVVRKPV